MRRLVIEDHGPFVVVTDGRGIQANGTTIERALGKAFRYIGKADPDIRNFHDAAEALDLLMGEDWLAVLEAHRALERIKGRKR